MAWSDYKICDHCGNAKVFYDANIEDERYQATWGEPSNYDPIGLKAICGDCNKTHQVVIAPRVLEPAPDLMAELVEALRWYGEVGRLARLITREGDAGRAAISADGGQRAAAALAKIKEPQQLRGGDLETCGKCMGSGYGGHPDSGALCSDCNGSGGVRADALALAKIKEQTK